MDTIICPDRWSHCRSWRRGCICGFSARCKLHFGATDDEVARSLPGDDAVRQPTFNATRAVTISARPEEIWLWLIQIGAGRAGWYSYDLLDNMVNPSAERRIIPQFQQLAVGDLIPISPDGKAGHRVKAFEPNR